MPTPEARAGFVQMMEQHSKELACVGTVLLGSGFWVSALQSVITGMRMISPRSFDHRINNSFEAVVSWLPKEHRKRTGVSVDPRELHAALDKAYRPGDRSTRQRARKARLSLDRFSLALIGPIYALAVLGVREDACARRPRSWTR